MKKDLAIIKKKLKALEGDLVRRLEEATATLAGDDAEAIVIPILNENLTGILDGYVADHRSKVVAAFETWWDKYRVPLMEIQRERDAAVKKLSKLLGGLGYVE